MAVTKRTRFEVLRRDNHTCQYCGAKAPDVVLQIDHVTPVALGGDDKPTNLLTACHGCNAGKTSIPPDSPLVASLSAQAAAYVLGMAEKMAHLRDDVDRSSEFIGMFRDSWEQWRRSDGSTVQLPDDFEMSLFRWSKMGVPFKLIDMAIQKTMTKPGLRGKHPEFQYFAGIVWNVLNEREIDYSVTEETARIFTKYECEDYGNEQRGEGYDEGFNDGQALAVMQHNDGDLVARLIDGRL